MVVVPAVAPEATNARNTDNRLREADVVSYRISATNSHVRPFPATEGCTVSAVRLVRAATASKYSVPLLGVHEAVVYGPSPVVVPLVLFVTAIVIPYLAWGVMR